MAVKTVLGQVIIWCDKNNQFDTTKISNIRNDELNFWGEIEEIPPPVKKFADGEPTEMCKWWCARIITNENNEQVSPPQICSSRMTLNRILTSTPEYISYRWKYL